jgi:carbonic anhydrase/acetyltransferase-like protein (isoleucine patch superfamily)
MPQGSAAGRIWRFVMPLYGLGGITPKVPAADRFWVAPSAQIIGDVWMEEDASVWFGSVLRGDNERIVLGARVNIQDACVLHTDMGFPLEIGADCSIGHRVMLHGCTIGENCLVGMGALVMNGARIGRNCLVGAQSLLTEGKTYPDNSLIIGSPARVIRTLDAETIAKIKATAAGYVRNWQRYVLGLEPLAELQLIEV